MANIYLSALRHSAFYTPFLLTISGGFLKKYGLNPHYEPATAKHPLNEQILKGRIQVGQSAVATSFDALNRSEKIQIVHFAQINSRDGFFIAARQPDAEFHWESLIGKEVLVDHFFQPYAMLKYGLHQKGISLEQLKVCDRGTVAQMEADFRAGVGDFIQLQGPAPQQLEKDGIAKVVGAVGDLIGPVAFSSLCADRAWLTSDMAKDFTQAYRDAVQFAIHTDAMEIARLHQSVGFFTEIETQVLRETIQAYQKLGCWQENIAIDHDSYDKLQEVFIFSGLLKQKLSYDLAIAPPPK